MRITVCFLFFLLSLFSVEAQDFIGGFQLKSGIPVGDFRAAADGLILPEMTVFTNYQVPNIPIELGLSIGYGIYGTKLEKRNDLYVGFNDQLRLRRNNNQLTMMGVFRFFPEVYGKVFPFIELQAGGIHAYTRYKIRESIFEDPIENERDFSDWARAYQLGGGLVIPFRNPQNGQFEIRLMYQNTSRIEYLTKGDTEFRPDPEGMSNGEFIYQSRKSSFNLIQPSIGLSFYFNNDNKSPNGTDIDQ